MGKIAFVFPGQGAQAAGMGKSLFENYAAAREIYAACDDDIIKEISWHGTREDLLPTKIAQRAIFMADLAAAAALRERGIVADGAAGFSLGEIPALAFAGLLETRAAYEFVTFRAEAMHDCAEKTRGGMMAVLGLSAEAVEAVCAKIENAWPVNYNAPSQTVVAYEIAAETALKEAIAAAKGKALPLAVAGAFHSPLMDVAASRVAEFLADTAFTAPNLPLYANLNAAPYTAETARNLLSRQINSPVRWAATVENMLGDGFDTFVEVGPGKTLTGLVKKISKDARTFNVFNADSLEECVAGV